MRVTLLLLLLTLTVSLTLAGRIENSAEEVEHLKNSKEFLNSKEREQQWRNSEEGQQGNNPSGERGDHEAQSSANEKVSNDGGHGGHGGELSFWSRLQDVWLNLSDFHLIFIPVIFLTLFFVILVAAYSPLNSHTHYLVDATKGGALYGVGAGGGGHGGHRGGIRGKSGNSDAAVTKRVLEGIEKMQQQMKLEQIQRRRR